MPILQMGTLRFRETWYLVMIMFVQGQSWNSKQAIQDQSLRPSTTAFGYTASQGSRASAPEKNI